MIYHVSRKNHIILLRNCRRMSFLWPCSAVAMGWGKHWTYTNWGHLMVRIIRVPREFARSRRPYWRMPSIDNKLHWLSVVGPEKYRIHYSDVIMGAMVSYITGFWIAYNRLFRRRSTKTSKLRVTGLCVGNSPVTGEFPAQRTSNAENVSIWRRHHH